MLKEYFKEIGHIQFLSVTEEKELTAKIRNFSEAYDLLCQRKISINEYEQLQQDVVHARKRLVEAHLKLVPQIAKQYAHCGVSLEDLVNEGNLGLLNAVEKFDAAIGTKFITCAYHFIFQRIFSCVNDKIINIPLAINDELKTLEKTINKLKTELNSEPTLEQISLEIGLSKRKTTRLLGLMNSNTCYIEHDIVAPSNEKQNNAKEIVDQLLASLPSKDAQIIRMYHGIGADSPMTLDEVGKHFGVCKERIRQIKNQAFKKLKCIAERNQRA